MRLIIMLLFLFATFIEKGGDRYILGATGCNGPTKPSESLEDPARGFADGSSTISKLAFPWDVALDALGNIYVADAFNHRIRRIDSSGNLVTIAGSGEQGFSDGPGTNAKFSIPRGLTLDTMGNIYIADSGNSRIRRIDSSGNVTTIAGTGEEGADPSDGPGISAKFGLPYGAAVDANGNIYVADSALIRRIDPSRNVTTIAGTGESGFADGPGATAKFNLPWGIAVDATGNVYVTDLVNDRIRRIDPSGDVTTIAGTGERGFADGPGATAKFSSPRGITLDANGNIYVTDSGNHRIRRIDASGNVTTIAGTGKRGFADGPGTSAEFSDSEGVALDIMGNIYVADSGNHRIRRIDASGNVTTIAGGSVE